MDLIESQAVDIKYNTEERVVIQIENVYFPVRYIRAQKIIHKYYTKMMI